MGTQTIWLARHGTRQDTVDPTWRERAARPFDPPLAEHGLAEAQRLAARVAAEVRSGGHRVARVYASPFLRAVQTAHPIAEALGRPLRVDTGAGEWMHPDWFDSVPPLLPDTECEHPFERLDAAYVSPPMVYPELWRDACRRAAKAVRRLVREDGDLVIIGHGASVKAMVAALRGVDPGDDSTPTPLTGVFKLTRTHSARTWRCEVEACTLHLEGDMPVSRASGER